MFASAIEKVPDQQYTTDVSNKEKDVAAECRT